MGNIFVTAVTLTQDTAEKLSFILVHQIDLVLTLYAAYLGLAELNPVMRGMLDAPVQLIAFKVFIPILIAWLAPAGYRFCTVCSNNKYQR